MKENSKSEIEEAHRKIEDLNSRLTGVSNIPNFDINNQQALEESALKFKETVEKGTSLNLNKEFYKDYIDGYYKNLGEIVPIERKIRNIPDFSDGEGYQGLDDYHINNEITMINIREDGSFIFDYPTYHDGTHVGETTIFHDGNYSLEEYNSTQKRLDFLIDNFSEKFNILIEKNPFFKKYKEPIEEVAISQYKLIKESNKIIHYQKEWERTRDKNFLDLKAEAIKKEKELRSKHDEIVDKYLEKFNHANYAWLIHDDQAEEFYKQIEEIKNKNTITLNKLTKELETELGINKDVIKQKEQEIADKEKEVEKALNTWQNLNPTEADLILSREYQQILKTLQDKEGNLTEQERILKETLENLSLKDLKDGVGAVALGTNLNALGKNSIAIGTNSIVLNENGISIGHHNGISKINSIAIGNNNKNTGENSQVFGNNNEIERAKKINAVGQNNVIETAENINVNGNNNKIQNFFDNRTMAESFDPTFDEYPENGIFEDGSRLPLDRQPTRRLRRELKASFPYNDGIAIIDTNVNGNNNTILHGNKYNILGNNNEIGSMYRSFGEEITEADLETVRITTIDGNSNVIGNDNTIHGITNSSVIGSNNDVQGFGLIMLGNKNKFNLSDKSSYGGEGELPDGSSFSDIIIGNNITLENSDGDHIILGNSSVGVRGALSIGSQDHLRKIVYVNKGEVTATSTDAINGSQLYGVMQGTDNNINVNSWKQLLGVNDPQNIDLSNYYTKGEVDGKLPKKIEIKTGTNTTVTKTDNNGTTEYAVNVDLSNYYDKATTDSKLNGKLNNTLDNIDKKGSEKIKEIVKETHYTKTETDTKLNSKLNTNLDNIHEDGRTVIKGIAKDTVKVSGGTYTKVTKEEKDGTINYKVDTDLSGYYTKSEVDNKYATTDGKVTVIEGKLDSKLNNTLDNIDKKGSEKIKEIVKESHYTKTETDTKLNSKLNTNLDNIHEDGRTVIKNIAKDVVNIKGGNNIEVTKTEKGNTSEYTISANLSNYYSKSQVDSKLENIKAGAANLDGQITETEEKGVKGKVIDKHLKENYVSKQEIVVNQAIIESEIQQNSAMIQSNSQRIDHLSEKMNKVTALNQATASLNYGDIQAQEVSIGAGIGHFAGENAVAVGVAYKPTENLMIHANAAGVAGRAIYNTFGAGVSYKFSVK